MSQSIYGNLMEVGVFSSMRAADRAVAELASAGVPKDRISVVCSDEVMRRHFQDAGIGTEEPAGSETIEAATTGSAIGALLGGFTALVGLVTTGGAAIVVASAAMAATGTGALVGGLLGAMSTRGVEDEAANFYDRALTDGKILIGVEAPDEEHREVLAKADEVFKRVGAEPVRFRDS